METRKYELDIIRIIACFFVVIIHVASYGMEIKDPHTGDWMIRNIITCSMRCAVPLFFMISGILFLEKDISIKELYKKYIFKVIFLWCFWSFFYACIDFVACIKTGENALAYAVYCFVEGHYHLWFLPSLICVYILIPLLQTVVKHCDMNQIKYLACVVFIGIIIRDTLSPFFGGKYWLAFWDNFSIIGVSSGIVYFFIGYYIYKNNFITNRWNCVIIYAVTVILMSAVNLLVAFSTGEHSAIMSGNLTLGVLISSISIFVLFLDLFLEIKLSINCKKWIRHFSDCTLGIYLIHTFFIEQVFRRFGMTQDQYPTIVSIIMFSIITFVFSYAVVRMLKIIPVVKKWIV